MNRHEMIQLLNSHGHFLGWLNLQHDGYLRLLIPFLQLSREDCINELISRRAWGSFNFDEERQRHHLGYQNTFVLQHMVFDYRRERISRNLKGWNDYDDGSEED